MASARAIVDPLYKPRKPKVFNRAGSVTALEKQLVKQFVADQPCAVRPSQVTALATVLRRTRDTVKKMVEEAREDLAGNIKDYVNAHKDAMHMALANGDPKSLEVATRAAQWGMENISIEGVRVVDKAKMEDSGVRVFVGVKIGGMKGAKVEDDSDPSSSLQMITHENEGRGGFNTPSPSEGSDEKSYEVLEGEVEGGESAD